MEYVQDESNFDIEVYIPYSGNDAPSFDTKATLPGYNQIEKFKAYRAKLENFSPQ